MPYFSDESYSLSRVFDDIGLAAIERFDHKAHTLGSEQSAVSSYGLENRRSILTRSPCCEAQPHRHPDRPAGFPVPR